MQLFRSKRFHAHLCGHFDQHGVADVVGVNLLVQTCGKEER